MGYLTQDWMAQSSIFQAKIKASLHKLAETKIDDADATLKAMARAIVQRIELYVPKMAFALALEDLNLDSTDAEVDAGIVANLDFLKAMTGAS